MRVHYFDESGFYPHSGELPSNPVTGKPFENNPYVCTSTPLPTFDQEKYRARWVDCDWLVEAIPPIEPETEPEPEPESLQCPRFFGNAKLDLFSPAEQLAVVTATMTDPVVKLMYDRLLGAAYLTYEDAETEQGLQLLVDKELLTAARKAEIVAHMTGQEL